MDGSPIPDPVADLLRRVMEFPEGFRLLLRGDLESVAVLLGVHPFVVDQARTVLHSPSTRGAAIALLHQEAQRARSRREGARSDPASGEGPERGVGMGAGAPPPTAERIAKDFGGGQAGGDFLYHAPFETVAVLLGVHPSVVLEARRILLESGFVPSAASDKE